ncbi:MAG: DUF61 family protein [Ignisphaera sp.]
MSENIEMLLQAELRVANKHLPISRKKLIELLNENSPYVVCRDGSIHMFRRSELQELRKFVSNDEADKLYLPIVIQVRADMDSFTGFIEDELGASVVRRILGLKPPLDNEPRKLVLYRPHIAELRYRFPTVFQIAIVVDLDSIDIPPIDKHSYTIT